MLYSLKSISVCLTVCVSVPLPIPHALGPLALFQDKDKDGEE